MKVLVTGGVGFIGSNLIKRLLNENHTVHSLDNYSIGTVDNEHSGCIYFNQDIRTISTLIQKYDLIYHLAALSRIQPSFNQPGLTYDVNVTGTKEVLEFVRLSNAKVVYAGSSSKHHNPYLSPYASTKYLGEEMIKTYKNVYGLNAEIARFYNVYGPGEIIEGDMAAVIGKFRAAINKNQPLTVVGDGEQRRDFTHVEDIVDGLYRIGFKTEVHEDAWELGTGTNYSINEVADMFQHYKMYIDDQPGNYRETSRTNSDAQSKLGWKPKDRLEEYISSLV